MELKTIDGKCCLISSNIHATFNNISVISSPNEQLFSYIMTRTSCIQWNDDDYDDDDVDDDDDDDDDDDNDDDDDDGVHDDDDVDDDDVDDDDDDVDDEDDDLTRPTT